MIDDNPDIRAFMQAALEAAGYEVRSAAEGRAGLALLRDWPAGLVITDIFMPGQEGFETISRCRAEFPHIPIMVISAGSVPGMQHDFLATAELLGVAVTLRKPFSAQQLVEAVRGALRP